jgi:hypothetical protein
MDESIAAQDESENLENWTPTPAQRTRTTANRALLASARGDIQTATRLHHEARTVLRALGNTTGEATATINLAESEHQLGNTKRAIELVRETLTRSRAFSTGSRNNLQVNLAGYLISQGDVSATRSTLAELISALQRIDPNSGLMAISLEHLALVHALEGGFERAARLEGYCAAAFAASGFTREYTESVTYEKLMALLRATYQNDELEALLAKGAALGTQEAIDEGLRGDAATGS